MLQCLAGIKESLRTLDDNPPQPKTTADPGLIEQVESQSRDLGVASIGYTKLTPRWVFREKAVLYENAIILTMEMDKDGIDSAPSLACMKTVMETYRDLGRITNQLASFLRGQGYGAHAGHPLMGVALYPPLAQKAGLGWMGLNGIIITPEHGPRIRLAAVFTTIKNLKFSQDNPHDWVAEYCQNCRICIQKCPPGAIYEQPIQHDDNRVTHVDNSLCFPYFNKYHGCSICVAVCPFNQIPYTTLKEKFHLQRNNPISH
jgi:ferredoxin